MRWIRHLKLSWIVGLLALTASLLGANRIMERNADGHAQSPAANANQKSSHASGGGVVCQGLVAPESEIIQLYPSQSGEVMEVFVRSEQRVKKGDKLLRIDDRLAKAKLDEAQAGVDAAEGLLAEAKIALKTYELTRLAQVKAIAGKKLERESVEARLAKWRRLVEQKITDVQDEIKAGEKSIEALTVGIEVEELRLRIIESNKPDSKVTQAEAGLKRAKALRDQAQIGVDACVMIAPDSGVIMQTFVGVGSKFGPQIQQPAFRFYSGGLTVRAEVDQEWVSRLSVGQTVLVEDYSNHGQKWTGKVTSVANIFLPKRDAGTVPDFLQQGSQERVLECRISLDDGQPAPRVHQKVRVKIGAN